MLIKNNLIVEKSINYFIIKKLPKFNFIICFFKKYSLIFKENICYSVHVGFLGGSFYQKGVYF